jgi:hypothetical protein
MKKKDKFFTTTRLCGKSQQYITPKEAENARKVR